MENILPFDGCSDEASQKPERFRLKTRGEFINVPPVKWIIKKILPRAELGIIFGESGSGKTILTFNFIMSVVRGINWHGHKVTKGRVVYVVAEGVQSFRERVIAYGMRHAMEEEGFANLQIIDEAPSFLNDQDWKVLAERITQADIIVLDTFARVTPGGNENDAKDMGLAISRCQALHRATGALVLLVHHSGKDASKGSRGWSGIRAATDTEIEVTKEGESHKAIISKQRGGPEGHAWGFDIIPYDIGTDDDGDKISSCIYEEADLPAKPLFERKLGGIQGAVIKAFEDTVIHESNSFILIDVLVELTVKNIAPPAKDARDMRRSNIRRAITTMCINNILKLEGEKVIKL